LAALLSGRYRVEQQRGAAELEVITALAKSYTRGEGFDSDGNPGPDIRAVILMATARLHAHPGQIRYGETKGPESVNFGDGFVGWSLAELAVLNRYRVRAQ
jgi:hypothetical protein